MRNGNDAAVLDVEKFTPVPIDTLNSCTGFQFDLYLQLEKRSRPVLYRLHNYPCSADDLDQLRASGQRTLLVPAEAYERYQDYLRDEFLTNRAAPPAAILSGLKELNRMPFVDALQSLKVDKAIDVAVGYGQEVSALIVGLERPHELFAALDHDDSPFTHATNVCVFATSLAKQLTICDGANLASIASGALLHDLGNRKIPAAILNKPGKLTDRERSEVQTHVRLGFEELSRRSELSWQQLMMVYQHHERMDGSGYPVGVPGDRIDDWARICAVTTVFAAATSHRPYHRAKSPAETLQYLRDKSEQAFDRDIVSCFHRLLRPIC